MGTRTDWEALIYTRSEAEVLQAILEAFDRGDILDGQTGLEEMIQLMSNREAAELESRLVMLMAHILEWKTQRPTTSGRHTIATQRRRIARVRQYAPRFTQERILRDFWAEALEEARQYAEEEMGEPPAVPMLTWEDVFETEYRLPTD